MALMKFREPNQVQWQGGRPGHSGTQVQARGEANNSMVVVYTVTAGKVLYLCTAGLSTYTAVAGSAFLAIYTGVPVFWHDLLAFYQAINATSGNPTIAFWPPLEVPAGYQIQVRSSVVGLIVQGYIFGWEE